MTNSCLLNYMLSPAIWFHLTYIRLGGSGMKMDHFHLLLYHTLNHDQQLCTWPHVNNALTLTPAHELEAVIELDPVTFEPANLFKPVLKYCSQVIATPMWANLCNHGTLAVDAVHCCSILISHALHAKGCCCLRFYMYSDCLWWGWI